jgi:hypothetical protein
MLMVGVSASCPSLIELYKGLKTYLHICRFTAIVKSQLFQLLAETMHALFGNEVQINVTIASY